MTFLDRWQTQLPTTYAEFARLVAASPEAEAGPGLISVAILWPIRQAVQEFEGEALDAVRDICGPEAKYIFKTVQTWGDDPLTAVADLAAQMAVTPTLVEALNKLNQHFQAAALLAEALAQAWMEKQGRGDVYHITGQIKAALVNIGGAINIQSLTLHLAPPPLQVPPPPEPTRPPEISEFVGRKTELTYYAGKLAATHAVIITGMAGIGKTVVAAMLVEVWKARHMLAGIEPAVPATSGAERVFWHTFYEGDSISVIIWKLAGFLAWHGQTELWHMLQSVQQTGGQLPPPASLFDYLFQMIRRQGYLLCFDAFEFINDDPMLEDFVRRLQPLVQAGEISLIVTSRQVPNLSMVTELEPLTGLSVADAHTLLRARGLALPDEQAAALYAQTEGNPQLAVLAINLLRQAHNPAQVIARLAGADDLERYLIKEVDRTLSETDREIMIGVAILLGYPGTRAVIEAVIERSRLKRLLHHLCERHLLTAQAGEPAESYSQHALLRSFYYDEPSLQEQRIMHSRAGTYYEREEPDLFKAALHFERAGDYPQAARLATADIWSLLNQGRARGLRHLLEQFTAQPLSPELWATINLVRGEVYTFLGESELARASYQAALTHLATLPDIPTGRELYARACLGLGDLVQHESPPEALQWLQQGLDQTAGSGLKEEAALLIKIGTVQITLGKYEVALVAIEQGLALLPAGPNQWRISALMNLGMLHYLQGRLEPAIIVSEQGLAMSQQLHDYFRALSIWNNLGAYRMVAGDWSGSKTAYRQGLELAEQLGSMRKISFTLNLGILCIRQGDDSAAEAYLEQSLDLARQGHLRHQELVGLVHLAELRLVQDKVTAVVPLLTEAAQLAETLQINYQLPEIYRLRAQAHLVQARPAEALVEAERSVRLANQLHLPLEEGISRRVLGQVLLAQQQVEPAQAAFENSLDLLSGQDPYETARTQAVWGRYLAAGPNPEQGRGLLTAARLTFERLGAQRDRGAM